MTRSPLSQRSAILDSSFRWNDVGVESLFHVSLRLDCHGGYYVKEDAKLAQSPVIPAKAGIHLRRSNGFQIKSGMTFWQGLFFMFRCGLIAMLVSRRAILLFVGVLLPSIGFAEQTIPETMPSDHVWWFWPLVLLIVIFIIGIIAVLGGVGGIVLFVPIISGFFPFHLDFVRGAGLLVPLSGALAAGPLQFS